MNERTPAGLGPRGRALWKSTIEEFELSPPEMDVLAEACRTVDELGRLAAALAAADLVVVGSMGQPRPNLLFDEVRKHRALLGVLLALLKAERLPQAKAGQL
jgi:hypothetical protein